MVAPVCSLSARIFFCSSAGAVAHGDVAVHAGARLKHHAASELGAARHAGLPDQHGGFAHDHVVRHEDLVVDLHALLDPRHAETGAVDGRARADLHVVVDAHDAVLRHLHEPAERGVVAESVRADHGVAVDDHAVADDAAVHDAHAGVDRGVLADLHLLADVGAGADLGVLTDLRAFHDDGVRAHVDALGELRGRVDERGRVDADGVVERFRREDRAELGERLVRVFAVDVGLPLGRLVFPVVRHQHDARVALALRLQIFRVVEERHFIAFRQFQGIDRVDHGVRIADERAADEFCKFGCFSSVHVECALSQIRLRSVHLSDAAAPAGSFAFLR